MMMTLNVKLRSNDDDSERQTEKVITTLNAEIDDATLNVDLQTNDGSECRTENTVLALNPETKK